ncbi:unnamed protein product [Ostreobium quekettii]|uniref:TraB domain-containing protein n=1 Tax=Ostreobium quekettii TaxID=121088 RepID=A0A8S1IRU2_9CHLO|nr:unnamed protein product [Ostreobium quekettii]|eukprot:evm.model.scf_1280.1 EVM.evm.TU.scf_1280.1   scf_1280:26399-31320(+)
MGDSGEGLNKVTVLKYRSPKNRSSAEQTFYIVGTAHISRASCEKTKAVIREVKPEAVFLELCEHRRALLRKVEHVRVPSLAELVSGASKGHITLFEALYSWMLAKFGSEMEVVPGEEFRVAHEEAKRIDAKIMLGDRPVPVTIARMWSSLSCWQKIRLCFHLLITGISLPSAEDMNKLLEELAETDAVTEAIKELSQTFPTLAKHLIAERDLYMVYTMRQLAGMASTVVAVVGAGHLPGIRENWEKDIDIREIARMPKKPPPPQKRWRYVAIISSSIVIVAFVTMRSRLR